MKKVHVKRISGTQLACLMSAAIMTLGAAGWLATGMFPLAAAPRFASDGAGVVVNTGNAHLLHRAPVPYPAEALVKNIEGTVVAQLRLDPSGEVADAAILSGPQELRKAVLESVLAWHFEKSDAAAPQTIGVQFVKPAIPPERRVLPMPVVPQPQSATAVRIQHIIINGLPDGMRDSLRSALTVHEGDDWTPAALSAVNRTAKSFDSHLQSSVQRDRQDQYNIVIDLPPAMEVAASPASAPVSNDGGVMTVGNGVLAPILMSKVDPDYSTEARAAKYSGAVLLSVVVETDGSATGFKVVRSLGMGLDEKAIEAVQKWVFLPGTMAGVPVRVRAQIEVNFKLL